MLPVLSQHFGSGKTALVANFRCVLEQQEYINDDPYFDKLMKAALVRLGMTTIDQYVPLTTNLTTGIIRTHLVASISEALAKLRENNPDTLNLEKSYSTILELSSTQQNSLVAKQLEDSPSIFSFLQAWSLNNLYPLLVFFDELGSLEENYKSTDPLMQFWNDIAKLIGQEKNIHKIFITVAGKSATIR